MTKISFSKFFQKTAKGSLFFKANLKPTLQYSIFKDRDLRSAEPCSSPPACRWPESGPPGSDRARSQRSGSSSAAGEPPPRPTDPNRRKCYLKSRHYTGIACVNKIYGVVWKPAIMLFVTISVFQCSVGYTEEN